LRFSGSVWRRNFSLGRTAWTRADSPSFPQTTQLAYPWLNLYFIFIFLLVTRPWSLQIYASTVTIVFTLHYITWRTRPVLLWSITFVLFSNALPWVWDGCSWKEHYSANSNAFCCIWTVFVVRREETIWHISH